MRTNHSPSISDNCKPIMIVTSMFPILFPSLEQP